MIIGLETGWCRPWEVEDQVPALWADRWLAYREALAEAQKHTRSGPAVGETRQVGNVRKTRII